VLIAIVLTGVGRAEGSLPSSAPRPTGLRLLVADAPAPFVLDVDRGTIKSITGLPTNGDRLVSVHPLGKHALVLSTRICKRCRTASLSSVFLVRHGGTAATRLGSALGAVASRDGHGVWMLTRLAARRCAIHEVGLDGHPRPNPHHVSCRTGLVAELPAGLLVNFAGPGGTDTHSALLRPGGRVVRFRDWQAQPVVANLVLSGADRRTPLVLHDMRSRRTHRLGWPAMPSYGLGIVTGEPNGTRATVDFAKYSPEDRYDLWLLDTARRHWRHLPGMPMRLIPKVTDVEWTPDGRVVILSEAMLAIWRPGERHIVIRRVTPPKQPGSNFVIW
jgi:hypothetical protein